MTDNPNPGLRRVKFSTVTPDGRGGLVESNARTLKLADIQRCPHYIIDPDHYRANGSCLCDDPNAGIMAEWGYKWSATSKQWESP